MTEQLRMRMGTLGDYGCLAQFHYLRHAPVTASRVMVLEDCRPTVVGRYLGRLGEREVVNL